jgi:hypothetical protein
MNVPLEAHEVAKAETGVSDGISPNKSYDIKHTSVSSTTDDDSVISPTEEELTTLRRVSGPIPWTAYTVAFVELCERFSYYGTTVVCKSVHDPTLSAQSDQS